MSEVVDSGGKESTHDNSQPSLVLPLLPEDVLNRILGKLRKRLTLYCNMYLLLALGLYTYTSAAAWSFS